LQKDVRATLPFADRREFEEVARGFIAAPPYRRIMADAGNVAWDMASYDFLLATRSSGRGRSTGRSTCSARRPR